jgi:uncharacterized protein
VRDQLEALEELSAIDMQLTELDRQIEEIPAHVRELDGELEVLRNLLERERQQLAEAEEWDQQAAREISIQEELLTKSRNKQAGARNERELSAAQREIEAIKKAMSEKEEERLQLMEALTERRGSIVKHEAEIAELQSVLNTAEAEAKARAKEVESRKKKWIDQRGAASKKLKSRVLRLYEHIRSGRPNAVVQLIDETCQGCNMQVPPQMYIDVQRMNKLYQCPYCSRIIFFKAREEQAEE